MKNVTFKAIVENITFGACETAIREVMPSAQIACISRNGVKYENNDSVIECKDFVASMNIYNDAEKIECSVHGFITSIGCVETTGIFLNNSLLCSGDYLNRKLLNEYFY